MRLLPLCMLATFLAVAPASAAVPGYEARDPERTPVASGPVRYLDEETERLQDAVADPVLSHADIHARAGALFGAIPRRETTAIGAVDLRGWAKPEVHTRDYREKNRREEISVAGLSRAVHGTLMRAEVPPPSEVIDAHLYGERLRKHGLKEYDDAGRLRREQLGVYVYAKDSTIGVFLNKLMRTIQSWVGNEFAASTTIHEDAHARDHANGQLNPIEVRKGEALAYKTEYLWLKVMDPTGQKLSWARATIGKFARGRMKAPGFVADYLEHLAKIRHYGDRGDFRGLVEELGYQDRNSDPFQRRDADAPPGHSPDDGHP
ncbi:MAG: hypothetical protein ABII00_19060 [Elusimicrobiota bacterium]